MKLSAVKHVVEVQSPNVVEKYLALGWVMLKILPSKSPGHNAVYVLGSNEDEPKHYEPDYDSDNESFWD